MNVSSVAQAATPIIGNNKMAKGSGTSLVDVNGNAISSTIHLKDEAPWQKIDSLEGIINDRMYRIEQELYELRLVKEKAKNLKFKVGDAAKHAKYGNVLITDIYCKPLHQMNLGVPWPETKPEVVFQYGISYVGSKASYGRTETAVVQTDELMSITEMSETLFRS